MKGLRQWAAAAVVGILAGPAGAAPLFPDVPDGHWARDAVAALAAKGLVEGYPDGTFKGDRAASRWEVAMVVARLLAKMEQEHATFATRAELEELRKLVAALREELDALGVRVSNLEENVERLDHRVTELERITFYGNVETRVAVQDISNRGALASDPSATPMLAYQNIVGTNQGAGGAITPPSPAAAFGLAFDPYAFGVPTVTDYRTGGILTSGVSYTARATLGVRVQLDREDELAAGAEFSAYTAQGDLTLDSYLGVSAPYQSNPFTAISTITGGLAGLTPDNHRPFTRMTLDHFWVEHNPTRTRLVVGAFRDPAFDSFIYVPEVNPGLFGPRYLDSFGGQLRGQVGLTEDDDVTLKYEVMATRLADRNGGVGGASYFSHAEGATLAVTFDEERGQGRFNFLHAANEASGGAALQTGLITVFNQQHGTPWVNPSGFYLGQLGAGAPTAGIASTTDVRPVPMPVLGNDGITGVPGTSNVGNIGPQGQVSYGLSLRYTFDHEYSPNLFVEWGHSDYKPNKNSVYSTSGNAIRAGVGAEFLEGDLTVDAEFLSVDARYDPFVLQIPRVEGVLYTYYRLPDYNYYGDLYSLHDTQVFPHNREGARARLTWKFLPTGKFFVSYSRLNQKLTSLQDVRFSTGSLGAGTPNSPALGFSPGFVDPVFSGFSALTFVPDGAGNALGTPLENPRGRSEGVGLEASYKWKFATQEELDQGVNTRVGLTLRGSFHHQNFFRNSSLSALLPGPAGLAGENVNFVDLTYDSWTLGLDYQLTDDLVLRGGYNQTSTFGHCDPMGTYAPFAVVSGVTKGNNLDYIQHQPFLGLDWDITETTTFGVEGRYYQTRDNLPATVFPTPSLPSLNLVFPAQASAHPFNWDGIRVNSYFNFRF